ncbi:MAG: T9SS type A sorting domain-containing protein, partial [Cyclobacteriaceae bacterium]|nr:T9SS type A sorting domain-containing protein [Cyclobacteriaceae bacterium]
NYAQYQQRSGINLGNVHSDAYVDMVKAGMPFDSGSPESPLTQDELDAEGWPLRDFRFLLMDNRPVAEWAGQIDDPEEYRADYSGIYQGSFSGQAEIMNIGGPWSIENKVYNETGNTTTFDLVIGAPDENHGLVIMNFINTKKTAASPANSGISDLKIIRPGYEGREVQYFADHLTDGLQEMSFSTIRSQNFTGTTSWMIEYPDEYHWNQRKLPDDPIQSRSFLNKRESAAWEHFIDLCNAVNSDIWINVPISASDDYVTSLAQLLKNRLNDNLDIYVENDNEIWNSAPAFVGTNQYNLDEAADLGISDQENIARRAVELSVLFATVFGQDMINTRIRVVLASHAPMVKWWVTPMLNYINSTFGPPMDFIYAISRQTYFNVENAGAGLTPDQLINQCYEDIDNQTGSDAVNESSREDWVRVATEWKLPGGANSYEGGPHVPAGGSTENIENQISMHRSERMIRLLHYNTVNNWFDLGGQLAMHFTYYSGYNRYGCWGLTDDLHDPDRNYKMEGLRNLETITGIHEKRINDYEIIIYPNPGNSYIKIKSGPNKVIGIEVLDLQGRLIYRDEQYVSESLIPVNSKDGLYLVKILTSGRTLTKKIMIN